MIFALFGAAASSFLITFAIWFSGRSSRENARRRAAWIAECVDAKQRGLVPPAPPNMAGA